MAMQQKRPRVNDLVPDGDPGRPIEARQEIIPVPRIIEIEVGGHSRHRGVDIRPVPLPRGAADDIRLVAVLVHGVGELDGLGGGPADLEDQVDPGAVFGAQGELGVFGFVRAQVPQQRVVRAAVHFVLARGVGGVLPGVAEAAELEVEGLVGVLGDGGRIEGGQVDGVEADDVGGDVGAGVVDVGEGGGFASRVVVGEHGEGGDGLVEAGVGDADLVVARLVVKLDHGAVALAVPDGRHLRELRLDVVAVDGVDPHGVLVDGDGE